MDATGVVSLPFDLDVPDVGQLQLVPLAVREGQAAPTVVRRVVREWHHVLADGTFVNLLGVQ